jgi:hypothetical protein
MMGIASLHPSYALRARNFQKTPLVRLNREMNGRDNDDCIHRWRGKFIAENKKLSND